MGSSRRSGFTVDPEDRDRARLALIAVVEGDPRVLPVIKSLEHRDLVKVAAELRRLAVVRRSAVVGVLRGLLVGAWTPEEVQAWASFVRRGYVAGGSDLPVRPLDIGYDDACEEEIAAAVSRLDEIGDLVDGEVTRGEVLDLLQLLGEP